MTSPRTALTPLRFPFLDRMGEAARRELAALRATRARPGQPLLQPGDDADGAYLVTSGALRVFYITKEGREATLYEVAPGSTCVLAVTSTFNRERYPAWVEAAASGVTFVRVEAAAMRRIFDQEPVFREFIFSVLSGRVFELMRNLEEAGTSRMDARVAALLLRRADSHAVVRASQKTVAAELGTAREVVYRALRSLAARGLVRTGRMQIQILDVAALKDLPALKKR